MTDGLMVLVVYAMKLVIAWQEMHTFCMTRSDCTGCPYKTRKVCQKKTTEEILQVVSRIFRMFLESK